MPIRFDARFYLVDLPPGEVAEVWPGELADGEWIQPLEALRRWEAGSALLHPPAWHTLKALAWAGGRARDALALLTHPEKAPWKLPIREHVVERIEFQRGLIMVPLRTPTLPPATHTNCLLLGDEELWVVDPGSPWTEEQAILRETLDKLAEEGRKAVGVLLTHHHQDHTGGARALGLPIAATRETASKLDFPIDRAVQDGERFEVGPRGWRALHLPGHTRGHLCLVEEGSGAVVAGDLVAGVGTVIIDPPEGDMKDYLASLDRLIGEKPGSIYPAHGPVVPGGVAKLEEYLGRGAGEFILVNRLRDPRARGRGGTTFLAGGLGLGSATGVVPQAIALRGELGGHIARGAVRLDPATARRLRRHGSQEFFGTVPVPAQPGQSRHPRPPQRGQSVSRRSVGWSPCGTRDVGGRTSALRSGYSSGIS